MIQSVASVATLAIALLALRSWRQQDHAKRQAEFLDLLVSSTHEFIVQIHRPISLMQYMHIAMACHDLGNSDHTKATVPGAIAYIQKSSDSIGTKLGEALDRVRPSLVKLRSLAVKGQMFGFDNYVSCMSAVQKLTWQFDRIEAFWGIASQASLNWANAEVQTTLKNVISFGHEELSSDVQECDMAIVGFAKSSYSKLYR
jgi:hypothetical protein